MERKLKNELPVEGKRYKYIGDSCISYTKNKIYESRENGFLNDNGYLFNHKWSVSFSDNFVEIIEDQKIGSINHSESWGEQQQKEVMEKIKRGSVLAIDEYERSRPLTKSDEEFLDQFKEVGVKHDQNKLPLFTIIFKQFPLAIQAVAKRALAGHNKYIETDADWQNFARAGEQDPDRYKNAGLRHLLEEGEDKEEGMEGTTHEAAVVWNFLADLECKLRRDEKLSK